MKRFLRKVVDTVVVATLVAILIACGLKLFRDYGAISAASKGNFEEWKPNPKPEEAAEDETASFEELMRINPEVVGWIEIFDTGIDFPVVQGDDDMKYVNVDVFGEASPSGTPFLDYRCDPEFRDVYSIVYGHAMEAGAMFGDVKKFVKQDYFDSHIDGEITTKDGTRYPFRAFACLRTDAYDDAIYYPVGAWSDEGAEEKLMAGIEKTKIAWAEDPGEGPIVSLSTCESPTTLGRILLVGRLGEPKDGKVATAGEAGSDGNAEGSVGTTEATEATETSGDGGGAAAGTETAA